MKAGLPFKFILSEKNGKKYVIFDFKDDNGKRKRKWVSTHLTSNCSNKELNQRVQEIVAEFYMNFLNGSINKSSEKPKAEENQSEETKADKTENNTGKEKSENTEEAKTAVKDKIIEVDNIDANCKFTSFLNIWLETTRSSIAISSYKGYKKCVNRICNYFDENYPDLKLIDLTALQIQKFYNDLFNSGLSGNTIRHLHANIHKALKYAVKMDLIDCNVSEKVDLPKTKKFEATFYNKEELEQLFIAFKGDRLELIVHIAAYYGLRRSEIIGLKWDSVDFDNKTITVRRKVTNGFGNGREDVIVENQLKTESSVRTFPLIPHIEKMLKDQKMLEDFYSRLLGKDYDREYEGFICRDNFGKLITPDFVTNHFRYVITKNKLKKIRFHDLRHSCASLLLANGVSMKAIQEWMGHSTFNVTANFYSHLDFNSKIDSAEIIAKVLGDIDEEETEEKK